jgi:hypothetical protein
MGQMWHGAKLEEFYLPIARNVDFKVPAHKQENKSVRLLQMRAYSVSLSRAHKHTHTHTQSIKQAHTRIHGTHAHVCYAHSHILTHAQPFGHIQPCP